MANRYLIKVDDVLQKEIKLEADITGLSEGSHVVKVESYQDTTLLDSKSRNITVSGAVYDPDYQAVLDYATAQSITLPTTAQQDIDNQLLINLKSSGAWDLSDCFGNFKGTASPAFKLICWKRKITMDAYGSLTWDEEGVEGNSSNGYIDLKYNPSTDGVNYTLNNSGLIWRALNNPLDYKQVFGATGSGQSDWIRIQPAASSRIRVNTGFESTVAGVPWKEGLNSVNRVSSSQVKLGGETFTHNSPSTNIPDGNIYLLAGNNAGAYEFSGEKISSFAIGASYFDIHNNLDSII